jgi:catechol 2,3-dioxygenase-like lactoylglutathione lyase family enzyme
MTSAPRPSRLHHTAYVTTDLQKTRAFYEDLIGLPLVATWCEADVLFGELRTYCHCFFGLEDGSALAFFQFANKKDEDLFNPALTPSPFRHIALNIDRATQEAVAARLLAAGYVEPQTYILEHGYCRSLYVEDPNGMLLELTADAPEALRPEIVTMKRETAHAELERWLAGDHTSNNTYR